MKIIFCCLSRKESLSILALLITSIWAINLLLLTGTIFYTIATLSVMIIHCIISLLSNCKKKCRCEICRLRKGLQLGMNLFSTPLLVSDLFSLNGSRIMFMPLFYPICVIVYLFKNNFKNNTKYKESAYSFLNLTCGILLCTVSLFYRNKYGIATGLIGIVIHCMSKRNCTCCKPTLIIYEEEQTNYMKMLYVYLAVCTIQTMNESKNRLSNQLYFLCYACAEKCLCTGITIMFSCFSNCYIYFDRCFTLLQQFRTINSEP